MQLVYFTILEILLLVLVGQSYGNEDEEECSVEDSRYKKLQMNMDKLMKLTKKHICQAATSTSTTARPKIYKDVCPEPFVLNPTRRKKMVVCSFLKTGDAEMLEKIDTTLCTHALLDSVFTMDFSTPRIKPTPLIGHDAFNSTISFFKRAGIKVWVMVGEFSDASLFGTMAKLEAGRIAFAESAAAFVAKYGFDGFLTNWQYPNCPETYCYTSLKGEKRFFVQLMTELSTRLRPKGVSVLVHAPMYLDILPNAYDFPRMDAVVDFWLLDCLRSDGPWKTWKTADVSPVAFMILCLDRYLKDIPKEKIVVMVPATLDPVVLAHETMSKLGNTISDGAERNSTLRSMRGACNLVNNAGGFVVHNESNTANSYVYKDRDWVSMENTFKMRTRMDVALKKDISGVGLQHIENDDYDGQACWCGKFPLLRTINEEFRGTGKCKLPTCPQPPPK